MEESKLVKTFIEYKLNRTNLINFDFESLLQLLNDPKLINNTSKLLFVLSKSINYNLDISRITTKKFLTCYMVYCFPEIVLDNKNIKNYTNKVILYSRKLINSVDNYINITNFGNIDYVKSKISNIFNRLDDYINIFDLWKKKDSVYLVDLLIKMYYELEVDTEKFKLDCKKLIEDNIFAERNIILDKIKILGGYQHFLETKQKFEEFSTNIINVYEQIEKTIKTAYWDSFQEKLSGETPDYLVIIPLLKDIQNMLFLCIPNRYDIHVEIRENIDIDLIQQMVEHNAIDTNDIIKISKYIIYLIEQYQAKSEDSNTKKWSDALYAELNITNKLDIFFKHFFKGAFNKLENILIQKSEFESHPLYKLIKKEN